MLTLKAPEMLGKWINDEIVHVLTVNNRYVTGVYTVLGKERHHKKVFLPLRLNLRRGRQTGFGKRVQKGVS